MDYGASWLVPQRPYSVSQYRALTSQNCSKGDTSLTCVSGTVASQSLANASQERQRRGGMSFQLVFIVEI